MKNILKKFKKIFEPVLGYGLVITLIILIIAIVAFFSGAVAKIFGFEYRSIGSAILYFIIIAIIDFPVGTLTRAFPKALESTGIINLKTEKILSIILDIIGTVIVMSIVDYFMDSVSLSCLSILIVSFILTILSLDK